MHRSRLAAYPDRVLHGKVSFLSDVIDSDSRRGKMRIAFANGDYALKPNMFATVVLAWGRALSGGLAEFGAAHE